MSNRTMLKPIAVCVLAVYLTVCCGQSVLAQSVYSENDMALSEQEKAMIRHKYTNRINQIEASMNNWRGRRNTMLTLSVTLFFIGTGVLTGATAVKEEVEGIKEKVVDEQTQNDIDTALDVLSTSRDVGGGLLVGGGAAMVTYFIYTAIISGKQKKINELQAELDAKFKRTKFEMPESESIKAVNEKISELKQSIAISRTFQGFTTRIFLGSLLSGGLLVGLSALAEEGIDRINVDEDNSDEISAREDAYDKADTLEQTGLILLGASAATGVLSFFLGAWAGRQEERIEKMEDSLLYTMLDGIDIHPRSDGFVLMFSHAF